MEDNEHTVDMALKCLVAGICDRNPDEWHHCRRVERICGLIAREMDWMPEDIADLRLAALLHHMDTSLIPESALNPSVATYLHRFIERMDQMEGLQRRSETHADEAADIIAVADTFDRLISPQRYRVPISDSDAIRVLQFDAGAVFSDAVVEAFRRVYDVGFDMPERKAA